MTREPFKPATPRAPRFPIQMAMKYRSSGDHEWREAETENISRSGVLFRTDGLVPANTPIEMLLALPFEIIGDDATVICRGRVVRTERPTSTDARPALAATIAGYRLTHAQGTDPRRI